jgi:UDP-4-amino-4,6-dideoxy-N-acetyl-beta-L-altrosamine N-acetyltransferase
LGVRKVSCEVLSFNKSAITLHKKYGFLEEGILKEHIKKNGTFESIVILALFKEEWEQTKPKIKKILK